MEVFVQDNICSSVYSNDHKELLKYKEILLSKLITTLYDSENIEYLKLTYSFKQKVLIKELSQVRPLDHTMGFAIDEYVFQKLPIDLLRLYILLFSGRFNTQDISIINASEQAVP